MTNHEKARVYLAKLSLLGKDNIWKLSFRPDDKVMLLRVYDYESTGAFNIPSFITNIHSCAFSGCRFTEINIDNNKDSYLSLRGAFRLIDSVTLKVRISHPEKVRLTKDAFSEAIYLKQLDLGNIKFENNADMDCMFFGCKSLEYLDISNFDTSNVRRMYGVFADCIKLKEIRGIDKLNTGIVSDISNMFYNCIELEHLSLCGWQTGRCKYMNKTFYGCSGLHKLDIDSWDTHSVLEMKSMFANCKSLKNLNVSNWDVSNTHSFRDMFYDCTQLKHPDTSKWNIKSGAITNNMFFKQRY